MAMISAGASDRDAFEGGVRRLCGAARSRDEAFEMAKARPPDDVASGARSANRCGAEAIRAAAEGVSATAQAGDPRR
jgi:hypothetical protein